MRVELWVNQWVLPLSFLCLGELESLKSHHVTFQFRCKNCESKFEKEDDLWIHISWYHHDKEIFKCHLCDLIFDKGDEMKNHIVSVHDGKKSSTYGDIFTGNVKFKKSSISIMVKTFQIYKLWIQNLKKKYVEVRQNE